MSGSFSMASKFQPSLFIFSLLTLSSFYICFWVYEIELKPKIFHSRRKSERAVKVMGKAVNFEGVSEELQKLLEADMDQAGPRRRARDAFKNIQLPIDHILFKT